MSALWMRRVLLAAAAYNLVWGGFVILFPDALFEWIGATPPLYTALWQCIGMIVGVYGLGYAIAARDPLRHWPIVFVGLLGKILGPIGFTWALIDGSFPAAFGWTILTNDLIWWLPFGAILWQATRHHVEGDVAAAPAQPLLQALARARTQHDLTLLELSHDRELLVVFLRHAGCTFCREAVADLAAQRGQIEAAGTTPVLVHLGREQDAAAWLAGSGLEDLPRISDPSRELYASFELERGGFLQLFGPKVWWRGLRAAMAGHGVGKLQGDGLQMPGAFLVRDGKIRLAYRHKSAADRPDYVALAAAMTKA